MMLIQTLDFDQLHRIIHDADRVVAGVGEDWPRVNVFRHQARLVDVTVSASETPSVSPTEAEERGTCLLAEYDD